MHDCRRAVAGQNVGVGSLLPASNDIQKIVMMGFQIDRTVALGNESVAFAV